MYDNVNIINVGDIESNDANINVDSNDTNINESDDQPHKKTYVNNVKNNINSIRRAQIYSINNNKKLILTNNTVILDSAAEVSIFKNRRLLSNLAEVDHGVIIDGVNGSNEGMYVNTIGKTKFGVGAYYSNKCSANILSFGDCVDYCREITYDAATDTFKILTAADQEYIFKRRGEIANLYTCEVCETGNQRVFTETVADNRKKYSKREYEQAHKAREYIKRLGVVTAGNLIKLLAAGKIKNADITIQDVARSVNIWGKDLANLKGKTVARKLNIEREIETPIQPLIRQNQQLCIDIMYINNNKYLIGKFNPSEYIMIRKLGSEDTKQIADALDRMLKFMLRSGFKVKEIFCDGQSAVQSDVIKDILGTDIDTTGGESVKVIERLIRVVKERIRGIINTLPYELPDIMIDWLTQNIVYFLNFVPSTNALDIRSARERITGKQLDCRKDMKHTFGDYVQVFESETNNSMDERSRGAVALMPTGNKEGSWFYLVLKSWRTIRRNRCERLPMPDEVIDYINTKAKEGKLKRSKRWQSMNNDSIKIGPSDRNSISLEVY